MPASRNLSARELFGFLVWRDLGIRYKQTILGGLSVVFQPLTAMMVFALFLKRLAGIQTDDGPCALFTLSRLVHCTFFANSVSMSSNNLAGNQDLVSKIYFPPVFMPLGKHRRPRALPNNWPPSGTGIRSHLGDDRIPAFGASARAIGLRLRSLSRPAFFYFFQNCLSFGAWSGASRTSSAPEFPSQILGHNWGSASNLSICALPNAMQAVRRPTPYG